MYRNKTVFTILGFLILLPAFFPAVPAFPGADREEVELLWVVDGDTISVKRAGGKRNVRFIGMDTPETRRNRQAYRQSEKRKKDIDGVILQGKRARKFLASMMKRGDRLFLEYDVQREDRYGRLLAYVYLADGRMANEEMLLGGYAVVMTVPPNVRYEERFLKAMRAARENKAGLWGDGE